MELNVKKISTIVYNGYEENPIVQYCRDQIRKAGYDSEILQLKDLPIEKCNHSKMVLEKLGNTSYVGDQLRLWLGMNTDDFFYCDADCALYKPELIKPNTVACDGDLDNGKPRINEGAFFYDCKDWCRYYFDIYQKNAKDLIYWKDGTALVNYRVREEFPYGGKINIVRSDTLPHTLCRHFFLSQFSRFFNICEDRGVVYYSLDNKPRLEKLDKIYWVLNDCTNEVGSFMNQIWFFDTYHNDDLVYLWKKQMCYTLGNPLIHFVEI